jgi:hypothetical protein
LVSFKYNGCTHRFLDGSLEESRTNPQRDSSLDSLKEAWTYPQRFFFGLFKRSMDLPTQRFLFRFFEEA